MNHRMSYWSTFLGRPFATARRAGGTLGALVALAALATSAQADAKLAKNGAASVTFDATGPGGMKIQGKTSDLDVTDDGTTLVVSVPLANLTTGIALRDKHMREKYLEVGRFPNATLKVARSALKVPASGDAEGDAPASMSIHGKELPVTIHYRAKRDGGAFDVNGTTHVNIKDYGIEVPSYLGVTVKPDVDIAAHFAAREG